jgi:hypothetical protein
MVYLVEDWENLEKYARHASANKLTGLYQLIEVDGKAEIRVWVGSCGFKKQFENPGDQKLVDIKDFCAKQQFTEISGNIPDDKFFNP